MAKIKPDADAPIPRNPPPADQPDPKTAAEQNSPAPRRAPTLGFVAHESQQALIAALNVHIGDHKSLRDKSEAALADARLRQAATAAQIQRLAERCKELETAASWANPHVVLATVLVAVGGAALSVAGAAPGVADVVKWCLITGGVTAVVAGLGVTWLGVWLGRRGHPAGKGPPQ